MKTLYLIATLKGYGAEKSHIDLKLYRNNSCIYTYNPWGILRLDRDWWKLR